MYYLISFLFQLIVVSIRPSLKVLFTDIIKADPCSLPFLSWHFAESILAFARDQNIYFYEVRNIFINYYKSKFILFLFFNVHNLSQVKRKKNNKLRCIVIQKLLLNYSLLTCHWLNTRIVAALDIKEQLHLLDVVTKQELEKLDLSSVGLIYNSSHFKGLSTGRNVSKAMVNQ